MKLIFKTMLIALAFISFSSCDLGGDDNFSTQNCTYLAGIATTAVTGPITANVNEEISLTVSFTLANNCGKFHLFNEAIGANRDKIITVNAIFEGCNCDNVPVAKTETYKFKAVSEGVYNLKFKKANDEFLMHTITVE